MRVLVVGVGVIGSYTAHALCAAHNDVTVIARGTWGESIRHDGLRLHHYVQHTTTVDYPRVIESIQAIPAREHFDVAFSVMRQDQQMAALPDLATIDADLLVLVGNDLRAEEAEKQLAAKGFRGRILFGFQSTAGNREGNHVEVVRWGATGLDVGPLHGEPEQRDEDLLARVFTGSYRPHWTHDFNDWLTVHATAVVPMVYVSYICGCDLHKASNELLHRMVAAQAEGYALLERLGYQILPKSDQDLFVSPVKVRAWYAFVWLLAHTEIGTLCCDDHAKHAPDEMRALANGMDALRAKAPGFPMPAWESLERAMGSWDDVLARLA